MPAEQKPFEATGRKRLVSGVHFEAQRRLWKSILGVHGVPVDTWTGPKTADDLMKELETGDSVLGLNEAGELRRYTSVAFVDVFSTGPDGQKYRLVETKQVFKDRFDKETGEPLVRVRDTLQSSVGEKLIIAQSEGPEAGARRGLWEELGVTADEVTFHGSQMREAPSGSYPGIITCSTDYLFSVNVPFNREGFKEDQATKINYFEWRPILPGPAE